MSGTFWLTEEQFSKIKPLLPNTPRGVPPEYGPAKTLYNRYKRWSEAGVFAFEALAQESADFRTLMLDATHALPGRGFLKPREEAS